MPKPVKLAIFGAGRWGNHLVRNVLAHPEAELVAIADPQTTMLHSLADRYDLTGIRLSPDPASALQYPDLEAVIVATPAVTHFDLIRAALERGCHVLAEKPLTLEPEASVALCQLAEAQQRQLVLDHTYLFNGAVRQGQATVETGVLGELRYGYAARTHLGPVRQDVDALWDLAIHDLAIFYSWLGEMPVRVRAEGRTWLQPRPENPLGSPAGLADWVQATLEYASGLVVTLHLSWLNPDKQRRLVLVGSQGSLIFDELRTDAPLVLQRGRLEPRGAQFVPAQQSTEAIAVSPSEPLYQVCDHFLHCARHNVPSAVSSGWLGAQLVAVLRSLSDSLHREGQTVSVPAILPEGLRRGRE
ncbi:Gfo/Idh/MocA family protein [Geitlerinema sp. PCC 7407]|uniref:Gfo/Idh/MocA family protein n=1 Tax=Geitlerinema sp. PCC 7407 TaxID=1173025 RepID=UPI00029F8FF3|nr:Gfo/Idh/MocA family oxidoreductase [Geitlerinema sp. PCC 7407]AFY65025.1 oxidoreductase domain protein [Geitlerinema sp. PCC 7407]